MRPRRSSGVVVRPLNFTVRKTHPGSNARNPGPSVWLRSTSAATCSIVVQPSSLDASRRVRLVASMQAVSPGFSVIVFVHRRTSSIQVGARANAAWVEPELRSGPGAARDSGAFAYRQGALNLETMLPSLAAVEPHAHSGNLWGAF